MPDYSNGKIYKLVSDKTDMIYIGSTTTNLNIRLSAHKSYFNKNMGYVTSKKLFKLYGNISIELIKLFPCNCKKELEKEEGKYIRQYKNICVNKLIAGRTKKEYDKKYYEENKEENRKKKKEYDKKYYENNKQIIKEKKKEKYKCICGSEITKWLKQDITN
jgi:hypothetical protein